MKMKILWGKGYEMNTDHPWHGEQQVDDGKEVNVSIR